MAQYVLVRVSDGAINPGEVPAPERFRPRRGSGPGEVPAQPRRGSGPGEVPAPERFRPRRGSALLKINPGAVPATPERCQEERCQETAHEKSTPERFWPERFWPNAGEVLAERFWPNPGAVPGGKSTPERCQEKRRCSGRNRLHLRDPAGVRRCLVARFLSYGQRGGQFQALNMRRALNSVISAIRVGSASRAAATAATISGRYAGSERWPRWLVGA